jgi:hypothetical protein
MIIAVVAAITTVVWFHNNDKTTESSSVETGDAAAITTTELASLLDEDDQLWLESEAAIAQANAYKERHPNMNESEKEVYDTLAFAAVRKYVQYQQSQVGLEPYDDPRLEDEVDHKPTYGDDYPHGYPEPPTPVASLEASASSSK